jgi:hypothetical protein
LQNRTGTRASPVGAASCSVKILLLQRPVLAIVGDVQVQFNTKSHMTNTIKIFGLAGFALAFVAHACAVEDTDAGKWKGQFDSQIGVQKYTFEFKVDGDKLTGKAIGEREMGTNEVQITEGKINKDDISFIEPLKFDDNDIRIEYKGKISGDEIKFHRKVGDFAEEDFVAKRVKDSGAAAKPESKPESKPETNAPPPAPQKLRMQQ